MKKLLMFIFTVLLLSGCTIGNASYYDKVAETVISLYRIDVYDKKNIRDEDVNAIDVYLSQITHVNQAVDLTDFLDKARPTNDKDSSTVFVRGDRCYIAYADVKAAFDKIYANPDAHDEISYTVSCNGYYATLYETDFYPDYSVTQNDPVHDYILLKTYEENGNRIYIYRSTYNGVGLKLTLYISDHIYKIDTTQVNADTYLD